MAGDIQEAFEEEDYSGAATYNIDEINFIDTVNQSTLTHQQPSQMKMKYAEHVDYSFTKEEKKFLNKDSLNGTCVIDNFIGMYGEELKITRDDFIKLHQDFYKNIYAISSSPLDFGINTNETWRLDNGITPLFLEYVCKKYDNSHYKYMILMMNVS